MKKRARAQVLWPTVLTQFSGERSGAGKGFCTSATVLAR